MVTTTADAEQLSLDVNYQPLVVPVRRRATLDETFDAFHEANPWVLDALVAFTRRYLAAGHTRVSIKMLFEVLRWDYSRRPENGASPWRLNNSLTSRYARAIVAAHPDLAGAYKTRELRTAS